MKPIAQKQTRNAELHAHEWETLLVTFLTAAVIVGVLFWSGLDRKSGGMMVPGSISPGAQAFARA